MNSEWVNVAVSVVLFAAFGFHLLMSLRLWLREHSARSLRGLYIAAMIEVAMVGFIFGSVGRLDPHWLEAARFVGAIVRGMLLVGAIVVTLTWLLPAVREPVKRE